jgi:hypothetical protein
MDLRRDGMLKADARPRPPVILSFLDREGQRQAYPCDTYAWWEDNLHAIAVVLEDLRRAERYGVQSALLRAGFKAFRPRHPRRCPPSAPRTSSRTHQWTAESTRSDRRNSATQRERRTRAKASSGPRPEQWQRRTTISSRRRARVLSSHHGVTL